MLRKIDLKVERSDDMEVTPEQWRYVVREGANKAWEEWNEVIDYKEGAEIRIRREHAHMVVDKMCHLEDNDFCCLGDTILGKSDWDGKLKMGFYTDDEARICYDYFKDGKVKIKESLENSGMNMEATIGLDDKGDLEWRMEGSVVCPGPGQKMRKSLMGGAKEGLKLKIVREYKFVRIG